MDYCTTLWMKITLTLFTSGEFDLFCYQLFCHAYKIQLDLKEGLNRFEENEDKPDIDRDKLSVKQTFPVPLSSSTSTWEKDTYVSVYIN